MSDNDLLDQAANIATAAAQPNRYVSTYVSKIWTHQERQIFLLGIAAAIDSYAIWKNGEQVIGSQLTPKREILKFWCHQLGCTVEEIQNYLSVNYRGNYDQAGR